ncbi:hypothetical protein PFICI_02867 [Pestalotiopsis fici W106-1]|uniref:Uncharacterized protein n=1 Tax=Pestalotiopsis fici (strain W106-1 / CGMCC3.15140) TaxID=1229662 RepID=W3XHE1_PESFW|nr:uncharacterized protein PFICI_02867 [Pestalotiopsis fici W106-1]ETS84842.1 hypothetical protein PFICI_02867 [Pestalotiopsis fici W106-1]
MSGRDHLPPHPDQDPTETMAWVVAIQLQHVTKTQALLLAKIDKVERDLTDLKREHRRMSGGESATTESASRRVSGTASSTDTRSKAKATEVDVDPTTGAEPFASGYAEFVVNRLRAIDEKHPAIPSLKRLNSDLEVELYLFLGRLHKQEKQDSAADKKRTKASSKAGPSQKSRDGLTSNETTPRTKKRAAAPMRPTRPAKRTRFIVEGSNEDDDQEDQYKEEEYMVEEDEKDKEL